jgi:hypothetical protein
MRTEMRRRSCGPASEGVMRYPFASRHHVEAVGTWTGVLFLHLSSAVRYLTVKATCQVFGWRVTVHRLPHVAGCTMNRVYWVSGAQILEGSPWVQSKPGYVLAYKQDGSEAGRTYTLRTRVTNRDVEDQISQVGLLASLLHVGPL